MSTNFLKKLQNFIFQEKLLEQGDKVVIGISGGPDSIGLALALKKLQLKYTLKLQLIHINYHQRGKDSDRDEQFVQNFADENDLKLKVIQYSESTEAGNLEEQMRDFRYQKFEQVRKELKFNKIAVAHHSDDQVETFLMNLLRGAGLQGLTGMSSKRNFLIRPFLDFSKKEILDFLIENEQKFCLDKTNLEADFTRNKIRLKLIPFLEKNFNPSIKKGLGKLVSNLQAEQQLNQFWVNRMYFELVKEKKGEVILNISDIEKIPVGARKRLFREIILRLKGDLKNISNNNFQEFEKIVKSKKSKRQTMRIGKIVLIKKNNCAIFNG